MVCLQQKRNLDLASPNQVKLRFLQHKPQTSTTLDLFKIPPTIIGQLYVTAKISPKWSKTVQMDQKGVPNAYPASSAYSAYSSYSAYSACFPIYA